MTDLDATLTRTRRLHQIALHGLRGLAFPAFLTLSAPPLPTALGVDAAARVLVLRLIVQRQDFQLQAARATIDALNTRLPNLRPDDAFIFTCEATRVNLGLREYGEAIRYLLLAQASYPDADMDLQDYWHIVRAVVYTHMWDDQQRLLACGQARRTPPPSHPYHLCYNPSVQRGNLVWAMTTSNYTAEALPLALESLEEFRRLYSGSGIHLQFEANVLRLRALNG